LKVLSGLAVDCSRRLLLPSPFADDAVGRPYFYNVITGDSVWAQVIVQVYIPRTVR
jgi:hypothetical protein